MHNQKQCKYSASFRQQSRTSGNDYSSPAGDDALLLAVGEALEPLFVPTPPPERLPACAGCTGRTRVQTPKFSDPRESYEGVHLSSVSAKDHSIYSFELEGDCELKRMHA